jgi:flagellar L-ring protein precursor FlgH
MKSLMSLFSVSVPVSAALSALLLAGCANVVPTSIVQTPTTARPRPPEALTAAQSNGSIFQTSAYRPFFEDHRARQVGDLITITITENTNAVKAGTSSGNKSGSVSATIPGPLQGRFGATASANTKNSFSDGDNQAASNTFSGTIGVTVAEVLSNGNLMVTGEKQVSMDKGIEYIRFSGMINPDTIIAGNTVPSTQVADARVEYRTSSRIDQAEMNSMVSRFFLSVLPF